ncbi:RNA-splicing factor [Dipsacomyces acuminosporus]|nr:RNA-splicing factor [Dipsacomyces acuminosporus]
MYNGIGLTTPRGSGTSGHVVRNKSALKPSQRDRTQSNRRYEREKPLAPRPVDSGILEHERKRQVEVKCLELQDELESQGLDDDQIEERVEAFRQNLLANLDRLDLSGGKPLKPFETQRIAEAKRTENAKMARALRVEESYVEGEAFDQELQELKRRRRMLEREEQRENEERENRYRQKRDSSRYRRHRRRSSTSSSSDDTRHRDHASDYDSSHDRYRSSRSRRNRRNRSRSRSPVSSSDSESAEPKSSRRGQKASDRSPSVEARHSSDVHLPKEELAGPSSRDSDLSEGEVVSDTNE